MTTHQDPVVRDRLLTLPVRDSMTPDPYLLHRTHHVDTEDMPEGSGVSVGGLVRPEQPVEFVGPEPLLTLGDWVLVAFVLAVVLLVVFIEPVARWIVRATA